LSRWDIEERTRIDGFDFDIFTLVSAGTEHCENTQYCDDDDDSFDRVSVGGVKFHLY